MDFRNKLVFVLGKPFHPRLVHPRLVFAGKDGAYPRVEHLKVASLR